MTLSVDNLTANSRLCGLNRGRMLLMIIEEKKR
jgi:hypothetical protein